MELKDHPIYKYGYVVSHKEGGSQAHLETRNGTMTLGRYYVNFPNGSGQKVTYLADDVGYHTGVSYHSQTKKGSSKTQIAMGRKALATLENFDALKTSPSTPKPAQGKSVSSTVGYKTIKEETNTVTVQPTAPPKSNYTLPKGFYLVRQPVETSTTTGNHLQYTPLDVGESQVQKTVANQQQTLLPTSGKIKIGSGQLRAVVPEIKNYIAYLQPGTIVPRKEGPARPVNHQATSENFASQGANSTVYSSQKSIEKTIFSDFDAQLITKIQKHADGIIMDDLRTSKGHDAKANVITYTAVPQAVTPISIQPIVVTSGTVGTVSTPQPDVKKLTKTTGTINSLRVDEKSSTDVRKHSAVVDVELTPSATQQISNSKITSYGSASSNSTGCDSSGCEQDNNKAYSDALISIKPRKDLAPNSDSTPTSHGSTVQPRFYPRNRQKEERHYVTTIDVQKGISLDVQQNEDGSIQLASNFPFNKLPNYQRPYNSPSPPPPPRQPQVVSHSVTPGLYSPSPPPVVSNSVAPSLYSPPRQNVQIVSEIEKPYISSPVTQPPESYDVTPKPNLPVFQGNAVVQNHETQYVYQVPQPVTPVLPEVNQPVEQITNALHVDIGGGKTNEQAGQSIVFGTQPGEQPRKPNYVDEERREYFENLKKVEEIKQQNSVTSNPEIEIQSNGLIDSVTASPIIPIEANSVKTTALEGEPQHVQFIQNVNPSHYQNDVSNYAEEVPAPQPYVQQVQNQVVYQKPVFAYAPHQFGTPSQSYYETPQVQNVYLDNNIQQVPALQASQKFDLSQYAKIAPNLETRYAYQHPLQAEEKVEELQPLPSLPHERISTIPVNVEKHFLTPEKGPQLEKTILLNPIMSVQDYQRAFKLEHPVPLLNTYPMQLQAASEQVAVPAFYQLPQQYQVAVPFQVPQHFPQAQPTFTQSAPGQYHVAMPYRGTNKLRIQPLKPSPPAEEDTQAQLQSVRNVLSQPQFQMTYFYAGYPTERSRLQLRHVGRKRGSARDQDTAQSLVRKEKSLKNLRIEYGFKPPLRPSVEFTEEVKPSIYGPSVPQP
ncbi:hypothetical protein RUM44_007017 [Polyplax serrata]|uniref:Uncharacterized protein n=1 Tax=Polyplax serrata TaxID=468196 RepID=A0ABR1AZJ6_POLSC